MNELMNILMNKMMNVESVQYFLHNNSKTTAVGMTVVMKKAERVRNVNSKNNRDNNNSTNKNNNATTT